MEELSGSAVAFKGSRPDLANRLEIGFKLILDGKRVEDNLDTLDLHALGAKAFVDGSLGRFLEIEKDRILHIALDSWRRHTLKGIPCPFNPGMSAVDCPICFTSMDYEPSRLSELPPHGKR